VSPRAPPSFLRRSHFDLAIFGNRFRALLGEADEAAPGPGEYDLPSTLATHAVSFEHSSGHQSARPAAPGGPGPGAYELPSTLSRGGPLLGPAPPRADPTAARADGPGPGAYDIDGLMARGGRAAAPAPDFAHGGARGAPAGAGGGAPGPAAYLVPPPPPPPGGRFAPLPEEREVRSLFADGVPGPGAYDAGAAAASLAPRAPSVRMGAAGARFREDSAGTGGPGPAAYDLGAAGRSSAGGRFGTELRGGVAASGGESPGVGAYSLPPPAGGPAFAFPGTRTVAGVQFASGAARGAVGTADAGPGPAAYGVPPAPGATPEWSIPREERWLASAVGQDRGSKLDRERFPGPGHYATERYFGESTRITTAAPRAAEGGGAAAAPGKALGRRYQRFMQRFEGSGSGGGGGGGGGGAGAGAGLTIGSLTSDFVARAD